MIVAFLLSFSSWRIWDQPDKIVDSLEKFLYVDQDVIAIASRKDSQVVAGEQVDRFVYHGLNVDKYEKYLDPLYLGPVVNGHLVRLGYSKVKFVQRNSTEWFATQLRKDIHRSAFPFVNRDYMFYEEKNLIKWRSSAGLTGSLKIGEHSWIWTVEPNKGAVICIAQREYPSRSLVLYRNHQLPIEIHGTSDWRLTSCLDLCLLNESVATFLAYNEKSEALALVAINLDSGRRIGVELVPRELDFPAFANYELRMQLVSNSRHVWLLSPKKIGRIPITNLLRTRRATGVGGVNK